MRKRKIDSKILLFAAVTAIFLLTLVLFTSSLGRFAMEEENSFKDTETPIPPIEGLEVNLGGCNPDCSSGQICCGSTCKDPYQGPCPEGQTMNSCTGNCEGFHQYHPEYKCNPGSCCSPTHRCNSAGTSCNQEVSNNIFDYDHNCGCYGKSEGDFCWRYGWDPAGECYENGRCL